MATTASGALGELTAKEPSASFHVISKDGDYDPLLDHLRSRGIDAHGAATLASLLPPPAADRVADAIAYLQTAGTARPRRVKHRGLARGAPLDTLPNETGRHVRRCAVG